MVDISAGTYLAFLAATALIAIVPGPDHVYLGAVALRDGRRAGVVAASGMALSMTVHTLVAVTGIGALLAAMPAALGLVRLAGVAYLIALGVSALRSRGDAASGESIHKGRVFWRAVVVNLTNPKIVLFFLAFLPQFVDPHAGSTAPQLLVLGLSFVVVGFLVDVVYAMAGGALGRFLAARGIRPRTLEIVSGVVYLLLGTVILLSLAADASAWVGAS
ncbi:LysE family translocator [Phytohabitans kaempferiae]|uniref:LysE family translocator n=1 Tax=Phytohabitans kaempferiae TaxID=1620943 RepID=A0ABV6MB84_9ACTN